MPACVHCGESLTSLAYQCNYCTQNHCSTHRLPERHDCVALHLAQPPSTANELRKQPEMESSDAFRQSLLDETEIDEGEISAVVETVQGAIEDAPREPYSTFEPEYTVGTTPERNMAPSPDLNPDGSIKDVPAEADTPAVSPTTNRLAVLGSVLTVSLLLITVLALYVF